VNKKVAKKKVVARPFLKWVGGKRQILSQITDRVRINHIRTYYEPFVGGGAVFFALANQGRIERAVLNDTNAELIDCYRAVCSFPDDLIEQLKLLEINKEVFLELRGMLPKELSPCKRAARTIYLNKTSFNGLFRVNKSGKFNAPWGKYKNPRILDEPNLRACGEILNDFAALQCKDFEESVKNAGEGDVAYLDPPYIPISATSNFTSYTADGFTLEDHKRLAACFTDLARRGCLVIASNSNSALARELYKDHQIFEIESRRSVNCDGSKRGKIKELIIVGG